MEVLEAMNVKLDSILGTLKALTDRMDVIEDKILSNSTKITEINTKLSARCELIETNLKAKVKLPDFITLQERVAKLEAMVKSKTDKVKTISGQVTRINQNLKNFQFETEQDLLAKEVYDKRFNILVHGIDENKENVWETRWDSETKFRNFLKIGLKIPNTHEVAIVDVHRLPQHSISKHGKRIVRPIIAKLTSYSDKNLIMRSLKNLKTYNEERKTELGDSANYVYVTEHLPRELQQQKKQLLPAFKKARAEGKRAVLKIEKATYVLYIDNIKYGSRYPEPEFCDTNYSSSDDKSD